MFCMRFHTHDLMYTFLCMFVAFCSVLLTCMIFPRSIMHIICVLKRHVLYTYVFRASLTVCIVLSSHLCRRIATEYCIATLREFLYNIAFYTSALLLRL